MRDELFDVEAIKVDGDKDEEDEVPLKRKGKACSSETGGKKEEDNPHKKKGS